MEVPIGFGSDLATKKVCKLKKALYGASVSLPKSTHEALSHPGWRQAMVDEMAALHSNGTWDLVVLPPGKSTVGCR